MKYKIITEELMKNLIELNTNKYLHPHYEQLIKDTEKKFKYELSEEKEHIRYMLVRFWWNKYHIEWDSIHRKQTKFIKELFSLQKLPRRKLIEICKQL